MPLSRLRDGVGISAQKVADRPVVSSAIGRSIVMSRTYGGKLSMPAGMASGCIRSMELGTRLSGDCVAPAQLVNSCRPLRPYIENTQSQIDYCDGLRIATSPFSKRGLRGISRWSTIGTVLIFRHRKSLPLAGRAVPCMGPPFRGRVPWDAKPPLNPPFRKGRRYCLKTRAEYRHFPLF